MKNKYTAAVVIASTTVIALGAYYITNKSERTHVGIKNDNVVVNNGINQNIQNDKSDNTTSSNDVDLSESSVNNSNTNANETTSNTNKDTLTNSNTNKGNSSETVKPSLNIENNSSNSQSNNNINSHNSNNNHNNNNGSNHNSSSSNNHNNSNGSNHNANNNHSNSSNNNTTTIIKPNENVPNIENPDNVIPETKPGDDNTNNDNVVDNPSAKLEDIILTNKDVVNGVVTLNNKVLNSITLDSSIKDAKIVLSKVSVSNHLTINGLKGCEITVNDSNINKVNFTKSNTRANTALIQENTKITFDKSDINTLNINNNINVLGNVNIPNINIYDGEVFLDVTSDNVIVDKNANNIDLSVNKDIKSLVNNGANSSLKINSNISKLESNGKSNTVYIKQGASINNAIINGDYEKIVGNGTLTSATVNGNNVSILTDTQKENIVVGNNANNTTIGKEKSIKIDSIKLGQQGTMSFTLSEPTKLSLKDVSIICHGGKSMTILDMKTTDNKTYTLSTAYYKDNTYELYITLPNNKVISKEFLYSYNHPTAAKVTAIRDSETTARLNIYGVDEGGYIYCLATEKQNTRSSNNITPEYIKKYGVKSDLKVGYNEVSISKLEADKQYDLHYVMEAYDGRISPVYSDITIDKYEIEVPEKPSEIKYILENVVENKMNNIVFTFNQRVDGLKISDFNIVCPLGNSIEIDKASLTQSEDGKVWTMIIPDNYQHADNKYQVTINMPNGSKVTGSFRSHFNPPSIGIVDLNRDEENSLNFNFESDEKGTVYYGVYEWNGEYNSNSNNPKAEDILSGKVSGTMKKDMVSGKNSIKIDLTGYKTTKYTKIFALFVDEVGNYRIGFADHYLVPEYIPPVVKPEKPEVEKPEVQTNLKIEDMIFYEGYTGTAISMTFNERLSSLSANDIVLEDAEGKVVSDRLDIWLDGNTLDVEFKNMTLEVGKTYKLSIKTYDKEGNFVTIKKEFVIDKIIQV